MLQNSETVAERAKRLQLEKEKHFKELLEQDQQKQQQANETRMKHLAEISNKVGESLESNQEAVRIKKAMSEEALRQIKANDFMRDTQRVQESLRRHEENLNKIKEKQEWLVEDRLNHAEAAQLAQETQREEHWKELMEKQLQAEARRRELLDHKVHPN
jgi:hypothetical protein